MTAAVEEKLKDDAKNADRNDKLTTRASKKR